MRCRPRGRDAREPPEIGGGELGTRAVRCFDWPAAAQKGVFE